MFHAFAVFVSSCDDVDACGVDAAVAEDVGELGDVFFEAVKGAGEEVSEVVWGYFVRVDIGFFAKVFHFAPDVGAANGFPISCDEYLSCRDVLLCCVAEQFLFEFLYDEDGTRFALEGDDCFTAFDRFYCNEFQFTDAYAGAAYGLD